MGKLIVSAVLAVFITGCATSSDFGNYASASKDSNQKMAEATTAKLVALYPPAQTRLKLLQPSADAYGSALVQGMRDKGYSIQEYTSSDSASKATSAEALPGSSDLGLRYIVDAPASTNLYRVTVFVGTQSISRAFLAQDGKLHAAGVWVRKE